MASSMVEIVPAILRKTYESIAQDWQRIVSAVDHIQLDVTDGVFAGEGTFRDIQRFKQLPYSEKIELHMMVHTPSSYVDAVVDLNPARCVFHLESFAGVGDLRFLYEHLRTTTDTELGLALNPKSPNERLDEFIDLVQYVLFMGYNPGWANQPINPVVYTKIGQFRGKYPLLPIAVDGHVARDTVEPYIQAGARILCSNTAIFGTGDAVENYHQLRLLAQAAVAA